MYELLKSCRVEGVRLFYDVSPFLKKGKTIHRIICVCVCVCVICCCIFPVHLFLIEVLPHIEFISCRSQAKPSQVTASLA